MSESLRTSLQAELADLLEEGDGVTAYAAQRHLMRSGGPIATALAEAEARGRRQGPAWQPIETAPKDREILVGSATDRALAIWFFGGFASSGPYLGDDLGFKPTHWCEIPPLATAPAETQKPEEVA